ncbi:MAG: hypothetical protein VYE27_08610 [Pseudomonadota bacterium]|nr:hypothetical protein [Pseudomonadota bacterium]
MVIPNLRAYQIGLSVDENERDLILAISSFDSDDMSIFGGAKGERTSPSHCNHLA